MNRLERLYAMAEAIRRSGTQPISAAKLAVRFEVSRRTIERDLAVLRSAGVPLYADHGRAWWNDEP
jgi:predicted DNA-binding transcriptional regulator YafY